MAGWRIPLSACVSVLDSIFSLELLTRSTRTRQLRSLCTYGTSTCSMVDVRLLRVSTPMRYIFTYRTSATAPIGYYLSPPIYLFYHVCSNEFFVQGMYERGGRVAYCVRTIVYAPTYLLAGHITSYIPVYHTCLNLSISIRVGYSN